MTKNNKTKKSSVSVIQLFRFSTPVERLLIAVAALCSAGTGALQPVAILIYGSFISNLTDSLSDTSRLLDATLPVIRTMVYMGTAAFVAAYISTCLWVSTGERQARRIRALYLKSILHQDMGWFDQSEEGSLNTRLASDVQLIQDGISEKFGLFISFAAQFIGGFVVAFIKGWRMALVLLAVIPLLGGTGAIMGHFMSKFTGEAQKYYADSGSIAEQAFQAIRTVNSFNLQKRLSHLYNLKITKASKFSVKSGISLGLGMGCFMFFLFGMYGLSLWYGSQLVINGYLAGPSVFIVFLAMMIGSMSFVKLPPNMSAVSNACGAAFTVFSIIDRVPDIVVNQVEKQTPSFVKGAIKFNNVCFSYPTRPDLPVLRSLNLHISAGQTVAFVGPSGSGKSTIMQLLQRFYNVASGSISLDDLDINEINVKWLREQIGVVSQEPVLFNMTIRENILMGANNDEDVSMEQLVKTCQEANCHTFISQLPQGYDTMIGEQGGMLSGGQKQRIAIARAILKNPPILLLDEATSALDSQSERLVQDALNKASKNRTTIVVAHRLSTIRHADKIVVLDGGMIIEQGTHQTLLEANGVYKTMVEKQAVELGSSEIADSNTGPTNDNEDEYQQLSKTLEMAPVPSTNLKCSTVNTTATDEKADKSNYHLNMHQFDRYNSELSTSKARQLFRSPIATLFFNMRPEWKYLVVGLIGSALGGCLFPLYAYSFSKVVELLNLPDTDIRSGPLEGTNLYAFLFAIIGIAGFVGYGLQFMSFEVAGQKYSTRLRGEMFLALLKREVGFFDQAENNIGALATKLAVESTNVCGMITQVWGDVMNLTVAAIVGLAIAFAHSWALSLITLCMTPFLVASTAYEFYLQRGFEDSTKIAFAVSGQVAGEAIREVRTIAALNRQSYFESRYYKATQYPHELAMKKAMISSIAAAVSKGINMYSNALAFYAGTRFIMNGSLDFQRMFTSMTVIITTSETIGRSTTFAATFSKAKHAAISCFRFLESQPAIDGDMEGFEPLPSEIDGHASFSDIEFHYPSRPETSIFCGDFNLDIEANKNIALVGPSGCGKSTTISLLQRWYDPEAGVVSLDGRNIKSYSLNNLRSHMAIVSQEPTLFDMTIKDNITFGAQDNDNPTQSQIEEVCRMANIHDFINSLPEGYNTRVGAKGSQLSGGQKQRIAIARALIRKPRILLLDEATSALDSENERLVQDALDNVVQIGGRTTITIAHRLASIQNADVICVLKDGQVVEKGTHQELVKANGAYAELATHQALTHVERNI